MFCCLKSSVVPLEIDSPITVKNTPKLYCCLCGEEKNVLTLVCSHSYCVKCYSKNKHCVKCEGPIIDGSCCCCCC